MTEKLADLMHDHAAAVDFPVPDVATLARAGTARRRRRRAGVAGLAVAAVAATGFAVTTLPGGSGGDGSRVADAPAPGVPVAATVAWALDATVHTADGEVTLPGDVDALVRASTGLVAEGAGRLFLVSDGAARPLPLEETPVPGTLRGDADGSVVAFVRDGGVLAYDLASGTVTAIDGSEVVAVDGRTVYVRDVRGSSGDATTSAYDLDSGQEREVLERGDGVLLAAQDGRLAIARDGDDPGEDEPGMVTTGPGGTVVYDRVYGGVATFSPDADRIAVDAEETTVYDTADASRVPAGPGGWFSTGYEWLDDDTLAVVSIPRQGGTARLMTCVVPGGPEDCRTVAELDTAAVEGGSDELEGRLVLPVGPPVG